jgi:hypothetical protein
VAVFQPYFSAFSPAAWLIQDCLELGGFYSQLVTNVFVLPALAAFACYVYYLNEKKTVDRMVAEGVIDDSGLQSAKLNFQRNLMVGVFVMYPMMVRFPSSSSPIFD